MTGDWVHIGLNPRLVKAGPLPGSTGEEWLHIRQNKHHRWSLDEGQIYQYHLGRALHPTVGFLELGDEVTLVSLVCEDLAQIDNVG